MGHCTDGDLALIEADCLYFLFVRDLGNYILFDDKIAAFVVTVADLEACCAGHCECLCMIVE
jgi:hypothetical protein